MSAPHTFSARPTYLRATTGWVEPATGESFRSYMDRLAARYLLPLGELLSHVGVVEKSHSRALPGYGVVLKDVLLKRCSVVTKVPKDTLASMLLSRYSDTALDLADVDADNPDSVRRAATREWAYFSGSHFCPHCLKEDAGAWRLAWKVPWSFCCTRHKTMLLATCPACEIRSGRGFQDGSLSPAYYAQIPRPGVCSNVLSPGTGGHGKGSKPCGFDLTSAVTLDIQNELGLIDIQIRIDSLLGDRDDETSPTSTRVFFQDLRSLSALILYSSQPEDLPGLPAFALRALSAYADERDRIRRERAESMTPRKGPRVRTYIGAPIDPALMAAILPTALTMVNTDNDSGLQRAFAPFAERLGATGGADRFAVLKYFNLSPRLYHALESQVSKKANFNRKIASRSNAAIGDGHRASVRPHQVPQLIFLHQFEQVRAFFPHIAEHQARRFCAMAVLKLTGGTWREVANFLGLPGSMIRMANKLIVLLNAAGNTDSFRDHLFIWAKDLGSTTTGIDFSGRRDAMRDFVDIPDKHWQEMCATAGIHPGLRGGRSRHAAAWVWAEITQGDWRLAPSLADEALGKYQHDLYQTFAKKQLPVLQPLLSIYAKAAITDAETHATQATRPVA